MSQKMVVTGGSGFIGSNFLRYMLKKYPAYNFINIDKLTYAGNLMNLEGVGKYSNYKYIKEDICNKEVISEIIDEGDVIVNFAAESHVDNSILDPGIFIKTNVLGTQYMLDVARTKKAKLFIQISTDEVYGSLTLEQESSQENHNLHPSSPYSASKAAADLLCYASVKTFGQPVIITRSSNNFGPYQFPEKIIPLFLTNLIRGMQVPLYGTGKNVRDWVYVQDHIEAIDFLVHNGKIGEIYNIGGGHELENISLTKLIISKMGKDASFIRHVEDRLGHDFRYSLNGGKLAKLGWRPRFDFESALHETIEWYKNNTAWWTPLKDVPGRRTS
jgi:dTDP-glucose 4,6-dehydratase